MTDLIARLRERTKKVTFVDSVYHNPDELLLEAAATIEAQAQEIERLHSRLEWRDGNTGDTHYEGCWRDHYGCAMAEITRLQMENDGLCNPEELRQTREALGKAEAERDALRQDAERYRWIRSIDANQWDALFGSLPRNATHERIDRAIDSAMQAAPPSPQSPPPDPSRP